MFSRTVPRAASRTPICASMPHLPHPQSQTLTRLSSRKWRPLGPKPTRRYNSSIVEGFKDQARRSPIMFPVAVGCVVVLMSFAAIYVPWYYQNIIIKPYHNFPEPVAKKLRRAIFYSKGNNMDLREANKYFRQALQVANDMGIDPFSPEILGIKYTISALFEHAGHYPLACDVLEIMRVDCRKWMEEYSQGHWEDGDRSRVLKVIVQINVKLGELYDAKYMNQPDDAEKRLVEAVETVLSEQNRRKTDGVKKGEGDFMTVEEIGATLEALAQHYEGNDAHYLATPLFVEALSLVPPSSCHGVVMMNNISTCLAQQSPPPSTPTATSDSTTIPSQSFPNTPAPPRAVLVEHAKQWANKALQRAAQIKPPDRTDECDVGCAVATHNLGEFLEMQGKIEEARQKYNEATSLAKAIGFQEGQINSRAALQRLKEMQQKK